MALSTEHKGNAVNRKQADLAAGVLVVSILLFGIIGVIQLYLTGGPMRSEMESIPVMAVIGPLLMSLVIASIVGGIYVFVRSQVFTTHNGTDNTSTEGVSNESGDVIDVNDETDSTIREPAETRQADSEARRQISDILPDDERRILEPVIESPGLTQIKVRDRSGFSRSKVSQTITDLEERGLLYRESQGRTYRVYPADDIDEQI